MKTKPYDHALNNCDMSEHYLNISGAVILSLDVSGCVLLLNKAGQHIFGYSEDEIIGKSWYDFAVPEESRVECIGIFRNLISSGTPGNHTVSNDVLTKEGNLVHLLWNDTLLRDDQGNVVSVLSSGIDITNQKRVEDELRESRARFQDFAESSSDWFWEMDSDLKFSYVTDSYRHITGIEPDAVIGKTRLELALDADDTARWASHIADLKKCRPFRNLEYNLKRPDGTCLFVNISGKPVFDKDGSFRGYRGTGTNITERQKAELSIQAAERKYRAIFEGSKVGFAMCKMDGSLVECNHAYLDIIGYSENEARKLKYWDLTPLKYEEDELRQLRSIEETGFYGPYEKHYIRKNGEMVPVLLNGTIVKDVDGEKCIWSMVQDITEQKGVEDHLNRTLKIANIANRAKSDLMANMSHELRTPLNAIIGFSGTMQQEVFGPVGHDKYREYLDDIHHSGEHLLDLINDILDVSAYEAGALDLHEEYISPSKVVEVSLRLIQPRADTGLVTVTSTVDSELPQIYVDERRVKQILLNLLSNAVKFTPEGGKVTVSSWLNDDGSITFTVVDTGTGMDEEEIEKALSKFGQLDSGLDRKHEGTGLGLPLTVGLVEVHGGTFDIKSKRGHGTTITVIFPKERVG